MNEVYAKVEQHIPDLRCYARAIAANPVAAEDLVQDSLLRALDKSHLYRPGTNLRAWLFTILHNKHVSDMRRKVRRGHPVDPEDVAAILATPPDQEARLNANILEGALESLPRTRRRPLTMVALQGKSYQDVAEKLGVAVGTVKSRISRGRSELRRALKGREIAASAKTAPSARPAA